MAGPRTRVGRFALYGGLLITLVFLVHVVFRLLDFKNLFFEHAGQTIDQREALDLHEIPVDSRTPTVPRIIHQIFHNWTDAENESLPSDWDETRQSCIDLNPEWKYWLWTAVKSRNFISEEYPWFLKTYDGFQLPVQRIDALRYFLMRHYGGIYIDLDNGCTHDLEALRYFPAWTTDGGKGALSNNILGAEPQHPFWILLTNRIQYYAWNYPLPYITISYATGQWFLTAIWQEYHKTLPSSDPGLMRVMMDGDPGAAEWVFFNHTRGGTWDNWDNRLFGWLGDNLLTFALILSALIASAGTLVYVSVRAVNFRRSTRKQYSRLAS